MSQNSSWAKLVSSNPSAETDDQNPWQTVELQKGKKGKNASSLKKSESIKSTIPAEPKKEGKTEIKETAAEKAIESKNPSPVRTSKIEQKKLHSPAKIVNTPARSENIDTAVDSKKTFVEPLVVSWPSLDQASTLEVEKDKVKIYSPQSPVPSLVGDELMVVEKGKKWSKLPVQIRYNASNSKQRMNKSSNGKKGNQQFAPQSNSAPQVGEKPRQYKKKVDSSFNDNASTQSNQSSKSYNNRPHTQGVQNRNANLRKVREGNLGTSNSFGNMVQQAEQIPYFYTYYQPLMAGGVSPMAPAPFIDPNEQDPSNSLEMVKMWLRGQIEYYYSVENLLRDTYFRKQMSQSHGGVPLNVISGFNRVKSLLEYAKPYYQVLKNEESESAEVDPADMSLWLDGILKSSIESSAYLHLINDSEKFFVGIKEGWEYWIINEYPISPSKTTSDSYMSTGNSGKVNEGTFDGHEVSSFNRLRVDADSKALAHNVPKKQQLSAGVSMVSPPVTPSNPRAISLLLKDTLTDSELENIFLVIPSGEIKVDTHQAEWLHQGLLELEKSQCGNGPEITSLAAIPRFSASTNKSFPSIGWYWMPKNKEFPGNGGSHDLSNGGSVNDALELPLFDHPSCRFFKDCGFLRVRYISYFQKAMSELKNTGDVSTDYKSVLYSFWSCLLRYQFHNVTYNLFRDLALNDAKNGEGNGRELLRQIFLQRSSEANNEQVGLELLRDFDREMASNQSNLVSVGH